MLITKYDDLVFPEGYVQLPYPLFIYDIETSLMEASIFRLGEQSLRHGQLKRTRNTTEIICISAKWYGEKEVYTFQGDTMIDEFDAEAKKAKVCLGKNSDKFDVKHINTQRMMQNKKPYPEWMSIKEDLEKQFRKYFNFPSQSLDYISKLFGAGGKDRMEFSDWEEINDLRYVNDVLATCPEKELLPALDKLCLIFIGKPIEEVLSQGNAALYKMIKYNQKDVLDTEAILMRALPYITLRHNASVKEDEDTTGKGCITCGSMNLIPSKVTMKGKTKYQEWDCLDHKGYGGKCTWTYKKGSHHKTFGTMGP